MTRVTAGKQGNGSCALLFFYLLLSIFSALIFSILYRRSVNQGNSGIGWLLLTLVCAIFYGIIAYSLVATSSPSVDAIYYWLGIVTLITNGLAVLLLLFKKRN